MPNGGLGRVATARHHIGLKADFRSVFRQTYQTGLKLNQREDQEFDRLLKEGVSKLAMSEWTSSVVFVTKKDGKLRVFVDCRKLKAVIVRHVYRLPRMEEWLE